MNEKLHSSQIVFIMFMIQTGVTLFALPRIVAETFGTNGWVGLIFISAIVFVNLYFIYLVFKKGKGESIFDIWEKRIPKIVFAPIYILMICLMTVQAIMVTKNYALFVKLMLYKEVHINLLVGFILIIVFFLLHKGVYNIAKITTVFFFITMLYIFIIPASLPEFSFTRMTPFIFQGELHIWQGFTETYTAFLGYIILLFLIPFIEQDCRIKRAMYLGHLLTTVVYLFVCIISFGFFSFEHLKVILYPTLKLLKYVQTPFIERIENITFSFFLLSIVITVAFHYWLAVQFLKRYVNKMSERTIAFYVISLSFVFSLFFEKQREIDYVVNTTIYLYFAISFLLPIITLFIIKLNKQRDEAK